MSKIPGATQLKKIKLKEKYIAWIFAISLVLKGFDAVIETIFGTALFFITPVYIARFVFSITKGELIEDPTSFIANHLVNFVEHLSPNSQHFAALYLAVHGVVKLILVIALLRKKLWAYPVSIVVFGLFIFYEIYRFTHTGSPGLIAFIALDALVVGLSAHEYRIKKSTKTAGNSNGKGML